MAIVNMLLRPLTAFFLYKILGERNTLYGTTALHETNLGRIFSGDGATNRRGRYQDIGPTSQELTAAASAAEASSLRKV